MFNIKIIMNNFNSIKANPTVTNLVLLAVRIFIGFAMITHGFPKLMKLAGDEELKFYDLLGMGPEATIVLAFFAEFVCSIFIILGLFTRWAVGVLIIAMLVIAFGVHGADPFGDREMSLLYLANYLMLLAFGPGKYSVDAMISRKKDLARW